MSASASSVATSEAPRIIAAAELLRAVASPIRLVLVAELEGGSRPVHELVHACGASQSLVSQHLRVLRGSRLVVAERRGREVVYSLTDTHVAHIVSDAITHAEEAQ